MVNHMCEPIRPNRFASCGLNRALQGGSREPLTEYLGRSSNPHRITVDPQKLAATPQHGIAPTQDERSPSAAARIAELTNVLTAIAGITGGERAFEYTKRSAAFHEAGHAVIFALEGITPTSARIWSITEEGRPQWFGHIDAPSAGRVDSTTPPKDDIEYVRSQLAGVVSERLFDPDYRLGSSINEIATARAVIEVTAWKLQRDWKELWSETKAEVAKRLKTNEKVVCKIADELMRRGTINSHRIAYLLRDVRSVSDGE
jgi:hypothetical protein